MKKNKHTPTPWKKGFFLLNGKIDGLGLFQAEAKDHESVYAVCLMSEIHNVNEVDEANADYIVHCVNTHDELVEALELASREIATSLSLIYADTGKDYDTILREYPNYQKVLSALKKATN